MALKVHTARGVCKQFAILRDRQNDKYGAHVDHVGHAGIDSFTNMSHGPDISRPGKIKSYSLRPFGGDVSKRLQNRARMEEIFRI